jgi:stage II sporulation protein GA (sporulation sigma-E factor processing peptidase)
VVIYVDELFLENFIMNYIILYITAYFSKVKHKWYRLSLAAIIGATYVILTYIVNISIYNSLISKVILSVLIVIVGFNFKRTIEFLKIICVFYLTTFAIGGAGFCIGYFSDAVTITKTGMIYVKEISLKIVIISMLVTFIMAKVVVMLLRNRVNLSSEYFEIDIFLDDIKLKLNAFLDTGNTIHEPFSKRSVDFT